MSHLHDRATLYSDVPESVLSTTLTRAEFADALGMREDDIFVHRMFSCVAKTHPDKLSFCEFLHTVRKFSEGVSISKSLIYGSYRVSFFLRDGVKQIAVYF